MLALVTVPTILFMRSRPEDLGVLPDGDKPTMSSAAFAAEQMDGPPTALTEVSWTLKEAARTPAFWLLIPAFNIGGLALSVMPLHQIPYMEEKVSSGEAAFVGSLMAFCAMLCKPFWGFLVERLHARYCVMLSFAGCIAGLSFLRFADGLPLLYLYAVTYGATAGAMSVLSSVTWSNYFGRAFIGTISGVTAPISMVFGASAPLLMAWMADLYHSYDVTMYVLMAASGIGIAFIYLARQPVHPGQRKATAGLV
jgi:MFS family permease